MLLPNSMEQLKQKELVSAIKYLIIDILLEFEKLAESTPKEEIFPEIDLTSSGEIEKMEKELQALKDRKNDITFKYKPLIQIITDWIEEENLDHRLVLQMVQKHFESKK